MTGGTDEEPTFRVPQSDENLNLSRDITSERGDDAIEFMLNRTVNFVYRPRFKKRTYWRGT